LLIQGAFILNVPSSISAKEISIDQKWRALLTGERHIYFANYLVSVFQNILSVCDAYEIVSRSPSNVAKLNTANIDDLSDAVKLISARFDTNLKSKTGRDLSTSLASAIQVFIHSDASDHCTRQDKDKLRKAAYQGLQFEVICKQIGYSRNLNAHSNLPINDLGHASILASSFLRLQELFEPPSKNDEILESMNQICGLILSSASENVLSNESVENEDYLSERFAQNPVALQKSRNRASSKTIKKGALEVTEVEAVEGQSLEEGADYPIEYDSDAPTKELKRQRLMELRKKLLKFMSAEMPEIKRSKCILTRQTINELLAYSVSNFEDICQLPSFRYNFETNHETSMLQYHFIEHDILGILGQ
jgi:hypothetical protein